MKEVLIVKERIEKALLLLVRLGIGNEHYLHTDFFDGRNWEALKALAAEQGLSAIVLDGLDKVPQATDKLPRPLMRQWIGDVLQGYEFRYEQYRKAIAEMAAFYNAHGYKMMVLKGYACSLDWPRPEHRPCGDIDIWQFGEYKAADDALTKEMGVKVDNSHQHHTVFRWRDFTVENHYDFVNVYAHRSSRELEQLFKQLGNINVESSEFRVESQLKECSDAGCKLPTVEVYGEKVYLPSPNLHALFLLKHMVSHFTSTELSVRQILDWGFFVKAHAHEVDWMWLTGMLEKYHMKDFCYCLNAICVEDLGFDVSLFPSVQCEASLKKRILNDTLSPEFSCMPPRGLFARIAFKYKRWQANAWKQRLCYRESRWSAFWSGAWNHLLKPKSI